MDDETLYWNSVGQVQAKSLESNTSGTDLTVCMSSNFLISSRVKDSLWVTTGAGYFRHNRQNKVTDVSK